jgi:hypothetical protein
LLRNGACAVTTANLAEICDVTARRYNVPVERTMELLEPLLGGPLTVIALDLATAVRAGSLRAKHYSRAGRELALADAILLASAGPSDRVATADPLVLELAVAVGTTPVPLPAG